MASPWPAQPMAGARAPRPEAVPLVLSVLLLSLLGSPGAHGLSQPAAAGQESRGTPTALQANAAVPPYRRLLLGAPSAASPAAAASPLAAPTDSGTVIDMLVDKKCSMMHHALVTGEVAALGSTNLQPNEVACCTSCLNTANCTAWVYCPVEGGCSAEGSKITMVVNGTTVHTGNGGSYVSQAPNEEEQRRQLRLPYQGCRLLSIPAFTLRRDSPQILAKGPDVQFVSGTPVINRLPKLPGYSVRAGTDTAAGLGYKCRDSLLLYSCLLQGSAEDLGAICDADPLCKAFVFLPNGVDTLSEPIGIFKGGADVHSIDISMLQPNPATALYMKESTLTTAGIPGGGAHSRDSGSSTHVLWIVLPTVLAVTLVTVAVIAVYATLAMRQQLRKQQQAAETAAAMAAAEAATRKKSASRQHSSKGKAAVVGPAVAGAGAGGGAAASLTVHLLKPSPPGSGSKPSPPGSGGSSGSSGANPSAGGSPHSSLRSVRGGVMCPQCGAMLGIAYHAPVMVQQPVMAQKQPHAQLQPPQQAHAVSQQQLAQPQPQQQAQQQAQPQAHAQQQALALQQHCC